MCQTLWIEWHDSVQSFVEFFRQILSSLDEIRDWIAKETATDIKFLQSVTGKYDFLSKPICNWLCEFP